MAHCGGPEHHFPTQVKGTPLPNPRLKLAAPFFCGGHPFVTMNPSRRSLSASR